MRSLLFVLLVACGGGSKPTTSTPTQTPPPADGTGSSQPMVATPTTRPVCGEDYAKCAIATFGFFTDQVCACKDRACAEKINAEVTTWGMEMAQKPPKDVKQTPETTKVMTDLGQKYATCVTKLYTDGSTPPPDPCGGGADPCGG